MKQFVLPFQPESPGNGLAGNGLASNGIEEYQLTGREHHYLIHVRRYTVGDRVPALSPDGRTFEMEILQVKKDSCTIGLTPVVRDIIKNASLNVRITLMPAVTKGKKMDLTVRQAVEAGATAIWPVLTEYCQVSYRDNADTQAKKTRWERIAVEALQQCGGDMPVKLELPRKLPELLEAWGGRGSIFFLHERKFGEEEAGYLHQHLAEPVRELAIIVGPEGGLSPSETRLLREKGAHPVHLGYRVLRAETAAIYGLAAVGTIIRERTEWQPV